LTLGRDFDIFSVGAKHPEIDTVSTTQWDSRCESLVKRSKQSTQVLDVEIDNLTVTELLERIGQFIQEGRPHQVAYVNADSLNQSRRDRSYRAVLQKADLVYADGMGVVFASHAFAEPLKERLNAGDFLPDLCRFAREKGYSLYFLGGEEGVARQAAENLQGNYPGLRIVGWHHGFFTEAETPGLVAEIRDRKPDILLVGMGVPRQEKWIRRHLDELGVPVAWGVGALLDYSAGKFPRAPVWMRRTGLEWLFRFLLEPGRLWRRYLIGNFIFTFRLAFLVLIDILTAAVSWLAAYHLSDNPAFRSRLNAILPSVFPEQLNDIKYYLYALPIIITLWIAISVAFGLYRRQRGFTHFQELVSIFKTVFLFLISALAIAFLFKEWDLGRSVVFLSSFIGLVLLASSRFVYHSLEAWGMRRGLGRTATVIVGTGPLSLKVKQRMEDHPTQDHQIVGFLSAAGESAPKVHANHSVLGSVEELPSVLKSAKVDEVFFASEQLTHKDILNVIARCGDNETTYKIVSDMFEMLTSRNVNVEEIDDIPVIELGSGQAGALHRFAKRAMDITIALALSPFAGSILLVIASYLKLRWKEPVLFKHQRVGKDGKLFMMYKLRTMDPGVDLYAQAPTDPNDPRISGRLGRFLRRTSLDELPQLWNVLKGEMSLVGPRPEMPFVVERYEQWQKRRLVVKPGITGLWQIMGRKDLPLYANLEYDFYYIQNQSILFDLIILLKTLPVVLFGKGAY